MSLTKDHPLVVTASAIIAALCGKVTPSQVGNVKGGVKRVAEVAHTDLGLTQTVCDAITAALKAGAPDEWGQAGSTFRRAMLAELTKLAEAPPAATSNGGTHPSPSAPHADICLWVAADARVYRFSQNSEFSLHEKNIGPLQERAVKHFTGKNPTRAQVREWVLAEAAKSSEWEEVKKTAYQEAKARNYKIARQGELGEGFIPTPLFSAITNMAQFAPELKSARENGIEAAIKAAYDAMGIEPREASPAEAKEEDEALINEI